LRWTGGEYSGRRDALAISDPQAVFGLDRNLPGKIFTAESDIAGHPARGVTAMFETSGLDAHREQIERVIRKSLPGGCVPTLSTRHPGIRKGHDGVDVNGAVGCGIASI